MNKRQSEILKKMLEEQMNITSSDIAESFHVSLRTAQNDLKAILDYCDENNLSYSYSKKRGYKIQSAGFHELKEQNDANMRINYILRCLLFSTKPLKVDKFADSLFVSTTTLNKDVQIVKNLLANYDLTLVSKPYHGSFINGSEFNKRNCIINEKLISFHNAMLVEQQNSYIDTNCLKIISSIISKVLITNNFNITDNDYQNFLLLSYLSTVRCIEEQYLEENYLGNFDFGKSYEISNEIVHKIANTYHFEAKNSEIRFLASALYGKNSLFNMEIIPNEIEEYVYEILQNINSILKIDLTYSIELRVSLSLHLIPLLQRIKSNNQITNIPVRNIHKDFSFSFELAIIAAQYIEKITDSKLSEAEISYLAIHFNIILSKDQDTVEKKNILLICSSRRSDSLLIKNGIYNHFANRINQIDVKNIYELNNIEFKKYNVIFSTVLIEGIIPKNAIKINHFLTDADYNSIEYALNYGSMFKMVEPLFSKKRFLHVLSDTTKAEVIEKLVILSEDIVKPKELYDSIKEREKKGYTSYGNLIALPHPNHLLAEHSFCSVAILEKPILWSENNVAQIIILCCASKDSAKDLQMLFNFISLLFNQKDKVEKMIRNPSYENFIECLSSLQNSI